MLIPDDCRQRLSTVHYTIFLTPLYRSQHFPCKKLWGKKIKVETKIGEKIVE